MNIANVLTDLRRFLPIQFPLGVFIHNNMLFSFEDLPFYHGVTEAAELFGAERALDEDYYQDLLKKNRINPLSIEAELMAYQKENGLPHTLGEKPISEILWALLKNPIIIPRRAGADLKQEWRMRAAQLVAPTIKQKQKREKLWKKVFREKLGEDSNAHFHPLFIRFISAYLDQGMANWHNPDTHRGILASFQEFLASFPQLSTPWLVQAKQVLADIPVNDVEGWLEHYVQKLPFVSEPAPYLLDSLLELRGWAGMVNKFETETHLVPRFAPKTRLLEYLVVYLVLERSVHDYLLELHSYEELRSYYSEETPSFLSVEQSAAILQNLEKPLGLTSWAHNDLQTLLKLVVNFDTFARAFVLQKALDLNMRDQCLSTLLAFKQRPKKVLQEPKARFYFCIDDREESIRRLLEEAHPEYSTHGVVGFFGIDMKFKSINHPEPIIHCPPVVNPSRVVEEVSDEVTHVHRRRWGKGLNGAWYGSRGALRSLPLTIMAGPVTSGVLLLRVFFPHLASRVHHRMKNWLVPTVKTRIQFNAEEAKAGGYSSKEMAQIVATILRFTGTIKDFPKINFMVAHGATSANNPFKNAYGCGACSGKAGIPNGQIFCGMANNTKVRLLLKEEHGIDIPSDSVFVACYHDTSTDEILFFNRADIPKETLPQVESAMQDLRQAAQANSLERCRHFASARTLIDAKVTFRHVLDRAHNLAEPRPEYGHNNTAMTVVGRRELTRGLYLDRRCFLTSYDASTDPEGTILASVLAGAVPVAGGIALDYYFSRIDNEVYGSGTKLPLNIASLLGVMTGSSSDLRIGLARQMVELHEPIRQTIVVEAEAHVVERLINNHPRMKRMVNNGWVHFAVIHPTTGAMSLFMDGSFKPYQGRTVHLETVTSSREYAAHRRGPLPFVMLGSAV